MVLRGRGKGVAMQRLRSYEGENQIPRIHIGEDKFLRVVGGYKHLGAMATAALRFSPEVAARANAATAIEKSIVQI